MISKQYQDCCKGCKWSQGILDLPRGGIIELKGDWILNHYGGPEGFLGWIALQPRFHRVEFKHLEKDELAALGNNIKKIELALREYWEKNFSADCFKRLYIIYFYESFFDEPKTEFHLHIHLITRTLKFDKILRKIDRQKGTSTIVAWNIHKIQDSVEFPEEYLIHPRNCQNDKKVNELMDFLRRQFAQ